MQTLTHTHRRKFTKEIELKDLEDLEQDDFKTVEAAKIAWEKSRIGFAICPVTGRVTYIKK